MKKKKKKKKKKSIYFTYEARGTTQFRSRVGAWEELNLFYWAVFIFPTTHSNLSLPGNYD
jgi:transposase